MSLRYWEGRELARRFRDCIRCRLAVREGLGDFLSREERLNLLEQRLEYLLSRPDSPQFVDTLGIAGAALGVSETEIDGGWRSEYERPIYFVETRDGHTCCWCTLTREEIILQPHPLSPVPPRVLRYPQEVEVIGQVVGAA